MIRLHKCILTRLLSPPAVSPASPLHRLLSAVAPGAVSANPNNFAVDEYLVGTCGLTPSQALKASTKLSHLKSASNPDGVLAFLAGLGLSSTHVAAAVAKDPLLLCASLERTLAPTLAGLTRLGLSHPEIAYLVSLRPASIRQRSVVSNIQYFLSLFGSYEDLLRVLRRNSNILTRSLEKVVRPNVVFLRECGLGACDIAELCMSYPGLLTASFEGVHAMVVCGEGSHVPRRSGMFRDVVLTANLERVEAIVACAQGLGVPRGSVMFRHALRIAVILGEEKVAAKVEHLKNTLRWSDAEVSIALSKLPLLLMRSKDSLQRKSEFLISEVGLEPAYIAHRPSILSYSFERRLRPRYYVFKFLKATGLLRQDRDYYSTVMISEKVFMEKFVCPHKEAAPHIAEDYAAACRGEMPTRFRFT